ARQVQRAFSSQRPPQQYARDRDYDRRRIPFDVALPRLAAGSPLRLRCGALSMDRVSDPRPRALLRLRPVLRVAGRQPDVADVFAGGTVYAGEPEPQGKPDLFVGAMAADWAAVPVCGRHSQSARLFCLVPLDRSRPLHRRVLAALARAADVAVRP